MPAQEMLTKAWKRYQRKPNAVGVTELARQLKIPYGNVYYPLCKGRKVNADIWLKLMKGIGGHKEVVIEMMKGT